MHSFNQSDREGFMLDIILHSRGMLTLIKKFQIYMFIGLCLYQKLNYGKSELDKKYQHYTTTASAVSDITFNRVKRYYRRKER